jgi:transitional endoplasmic reticulum ATPase
MLCKEAAMAALRRILPSLRLDGEEAPAGLVVSAADFDEALREIEPAATRELRAERPGVTFADAGGLDAIKAELGEVVIGPMRRSLARGAAESFPQTLLFCGPSGVGKHLCARALAGELGMSVIELEPSVVLSRWPGETERALAEIFRVANHAAPCLLLLEDLDALAPVRTAEGAAHLSARLVAKLLREMRSATRTWGLVIVGTTDRPEMVDPAVFGRFELCIAFDRPSERDREAIFTVKLEGRARDLNVRTLAAASEGMTGEEIEAACRRASALAQGGPIAAKHLERALRQAVAQRRVA